MATGRDAPYPDDDKTTRGETAMAWIVLIVSGMFEAVWATALGKSDGFTRLIPTLVFFAALVVSMSGLAFAMKSLPPGTSYAVWVGIGSVLTILYAMANGSESVSVLKVVFLCCIVGGIIGLKAIH